MRSLASRRTAGGSSVPSAPLPAPSSGDVAENVSASQTRRSGTSWAREHRPEQDAPAPAADADLGEVAGHAGRPAPGPPPRSSRSSWARPIVVSARPLRPSAAGRPACRAPHELGVPVGQTPAPGRAARPASGWGALEAQHVGHPQLVLQVALVEQHGLHEVEVPVRAALALLLEVPEPGLGEDRLVDPDALAELQQRPLALGALEVVEERRQLRVRIEDSCLGDDGQPEEDRQDDHPQRLGMLGDEVVERRHDAVARATFVQGVGHVPVEAPAIHQHGLPGPHAGPDVRLAELRGDAVGLVVEVTPPVGPADVVEDQDRER